MNPFPRRSRLGLPIAAAVILFAFALYRSHGRTAAPPVRPDEEAAEARREPVPDPGRFGTGSAPKTSAAPKDPAAPTSARLSPADRLAKVALPDALEKTLAGAPAEGRMLANYIRLQKRKDSLGPDERRELAEDLLAGLLKAEPQVRPLIAQALAALPPGNEVAADRATLLNLVALYPPSENEQIRDSALASLTRLYSADAGAALGPDAEALAVTSVQAYLASAPNDPVAAHAEISKAMGGQIDPKMKVVYDGLFRERFGK